MKDAGLIASGLLSLQTTDAATLDAIHRSNIKVSEYRKLIAHFRAEQIPGVSELMIGLPGQRLQTCRADLQFLSDHRIHARIFPTLLMPNAPMADATYRAEYAIEADADGFAGDQHVHPGRVRPHGRPLSRIQAVGEHGQQPREVPAALPAA